MLTTTLKQIREHGPCGNGWRTLLSALGPKWPKTKRIPLARILDSNGIADGLWALRACLPARGARDRIARLFAADCAERALLREREAGREPAPRSWAAIEVARRFASGEATREELDAARTAARDASWTAVRDASWTAAAAAAWAAAWAAGDAAGYTAWADSWAAEREWQAARLRAYLAGEVTP